ncbi:hypothetical protein ES705_45495 [subsurface metagenome]
MSGRFLFKLGRVSIFKRSQVLNFWRKYSCLTGMIIIIAIFFFTVPGFATFLNWISILKLISKFTIIGMGEAMVMIVGGGGRSVYWNNSWFLWVSMCQSYCLWIWTW